MTHDTKRMTIWGGTLVVLTAMVLLSLWYGDVVNWSPANGVQAENSVFD